ncbi:hypothetical protein XA68_14129 [Ophiocordyceps unilateralis]|uniref:Transcription factor tau subunit sfc3/Tfc3 C-terminal domain-containing protein n=1 Tax=Ophiocordyceps unilateralis TaxID=268505 RepID=A0A2A9P9D4_OPHUN|nr:hypothetical protein XA68_14129 [Ophiocordyceps unilateralis]
MRESTSSSDDATQRLSVGSRTDALQTLSTASPLIPEPWIRSAALLREAGDFSAPRVSPNVLLLDEANLPRQIAPATRGLLASLRDRPPERISLPSVGKLARATGTASSTLDTSSTLGHEGHENSQHRERPQPGTNHHMAPESIRSSSKVGDTTADRIYKLINHLLREENGVVLGGKPLWRAVTAAWKIDVSAVPEPSERDLQMCVNSMLRKKVIKEHCHAFRDRRGLFNKCQLILLPDVDAFSVESLALVEKAKITASSLDASPQKDTSENSATQVNRHRVRGRRRLPEEVAILGAPVYAAQLAAKRGSEARNDNLHRLKRLKYSVQPNHDHGEGLSISLRSQEPACALSVSGMSDAYARSVFCDGFDDLQPPRPIRFLEPNTCLGDEDHHDQSEAVSRLSGGSFQQQQELEKSTRRGQLAYQAHGRPYVFDSIKPIFGSVGGSWPWFDTQEFDQLGTSLTLSGWILDERWLKWGSFSEQIENRVAARMAKRRRLASEPSAHELFMSKLQACMDVELAWKAEFTNADPGRHMVFVNIFPPPTVEAFRAPCSTNLVWAPEGRPTASSGHGASTTLAGESTSTDDESEPRHHAASGLMIRASRRMFCHSTPNRVPLVTRPLTALPAPDETLWEHRAETHDQDEIMAAFIAVRALLGGVEKAVDWGLLMTIYPKLGLAGLRRFWVDARKQQGAYIALFTRVFQERLIAALENDEIPMVDFENPVGYDWQRLIKWTMQLPRQEGFQLPGSRESLSKQFLLHDVTIVGEDWREKFFHSGSSFFARFEAIASEPGVVHVGEPPECVRPLSDIDDLVVARSWVRSLLSSDPTSHSMENIRDKFLQMSPDDGHRRSDLFKTAVTQLTQQRIIRRSRKPRAGHQPYRLSEWYESQLTRMAQSPKYDAAATFKKQLDDAFRKQQTFQVPYTLDDGAMMALTNMNAMGRIRLIPVGVPDIPYGFKPGNYESRKYPKSHYHFTLEVAPTEAYRYNEDIELLRAVTREGPPMGGSRGELPQWADFIKGSSVQRWSEILGAFTFAFAIRGSMTIPGVCSALSPLLEEFEARLVVDWGRRTGVLTDVMNGLGVMVAEWWWLAVPWLRRQKEPAKSE